MQTHLPQQRTNAIGARQQPTQKRRLAACWEDLAQLHAARLRGTPRQVLAYRIDTQLPAKSSHSRRPCHVDLPMQPTNKLAMLQQQPQTSTNYAIHAHKLKYSLASKIPNAWNQQCRTQTPSQQKKPPRTHPRKHKPTQTRTTKTAETRDPTGDLQIFSLTLSQLSYRGFQRWSGVNQPMGAAERQHLLGACSTLCIIHARKPQSAAPLPNV